MARLPREQVEARVDEMLRLVSSKRWADVIPVSSRVDSVSQVAFARALAIRPRCDTG